MSVTIAERLRQWRQAAQLTQAQAASELGVVLPTYVHWEHGDRQPGRFARREIERVLAGSNGASSDKSSEQAKGE